jgi:2-amino-4-hydroxy-6-hydroxymethyldihydropteridine diphosphokinase
MARVFLAVGSNLGNREAQLEQASDLLSDVPGIRILRRSPVYETSPEGVPKGSQGQYLNAVWELETSLSPRSVLEAALGVEARMGRVRRVQNEARPIDLDILFYDSERIHEPGLTVPHPRLHTRDFVLRPLADLSPEFVHPELGKSVRALLMELKHA